MGQIRGRLTSVRGHANIAGSMVRGRGSGRRFPTWALAVALAVVPSVTCVLAADMNDAQLACCAAMHHDCDGKAVTQDCCALETPSLAGLAVGTPAFQIAAPVPVAVNIAAVAPGLDSGFGPFTGPHAASPNPSGIPVYLLVSVFRL